MRIESFQYIVLQKLAIKINMNSSKKYYELWNKTKYSLSCEHSKVLKKFM